MVERDAVYMTGDEILYLCQAIGIAPPVGLAHAWSAASEEARSARRRAAERRLLARGAVTRVDESTCRVEPMVGIIISAFARPTALAVVHIECRGRVETTRSFSITKEGVIEQCEVAPGLHRLTFAPPEKVGDTIFGFLGITDTDEIPVAPAFALKSRDLAGGTGGAAGPVTTPAGEEAAGFLAALENSPRFFHLSVLHRPTRVKLEGGKLSFVDAGTRGRWLIEVADEGTDPDGPMLEIRRVSSEDLRAEITSYLPAGLTV
jgi:hypothetical protein